MLKLARSHLEHARELLAGHVAKALPAGGATIDPVFPGLTQGNRARLYTVKLPRDVPRKALEHLLAELRGDAAIEYADLPAQKQAMASPP